MSYNDHKNYCQHEHSNQYKWTNQKSEHQSHGPTSDFQTPRQIAAPPTGHRQTGAQSTEAKKGTKRTHSPENGVAQSDSGKKKAKSLNVE